MPEFLRCTILIFSHVSSMLLALNYKTIFNKFPRHRLTIMPTNVSTSSKYGMSYSSYEHILLSRSTRSLSTLVHSIPFQNQSQHTTDIPRLHNSFSSCGWWTSYPPNILYRTGCRRMDNPTLLPCSHSDRPSLKIQQKLISRPNMTMTSVDLCSASDVIVLYPNWRQLN